MFRTFIFVIALALSSPAATLPGQSPPPVAPVVPEPPPFDEWLDALKEEASARGIRAEVIERALGGIEPVAQILNRDRTQAEFTLDLDAYLKRRLTPSTVRTAREMYARHRGVLQKVGKHYRVDPRIVVAVWGLESNFGRFAGVRPTFPTLATLAYDGRRGAMFRSELFSALTIVNDGHAEIDALQGSWAGALGQPQFMPSSYLEYAQDFDNDGRRDIWRSLPDVFASVAYYFARHGWADGEPWGREVRVPEALETGMLALPRREKGCRAVKLMTDARPLSEWRRIGLLTSAGGRLPSSTLPASLFQSGSRSYLLYRNYESLLAYNCAHSYALSVGVLASRITR